MKGQSYYITHFLLDFALYFISRSPASCLLLSSLSLLLYDSIGCEKYFFNLKISISFREYLYMGNGSSVNTTIKRGEEKRKKGGGK